MADKSNFHPAHSVTNIKNFIPVILDTEKSKYASWVELFKIQCRSYDVIDHRIPATTTEQSSTSDASTTPTRTTNSAGWSSLDSIVLQWIYGTISPDLLETILAPDTTAQLSWEHLRNIFQDNEHSSALYLNAQFSTKRMENFLNVSAYCQQLKLLLDQLANVGEIINNSQLQAVATNHTKSALVAATSNSSNKSPSSSTAQNSSSPSTYSQSNTGYKNNDNYQRGGGRNSGNRGGRGSRGGQGRQHSNRGLGFNQSMWNHYPPQYQPWAWQLWTSPPPPYPTSIWARPNRQQINNAGPGILGAQPNFHNSSYASQASYAPTDIDASFHTLLLHPPDRNWYMDTGATSHMASSSGTLKSYYPLSINKNIVGNGQGIPVYGRLLKDNHVSLEFDPFGFTMKDFPRDTPIMRCNSTGDLYPLSPSMLCTLGSSSGFLTVSQQLWHHRLGHPGNNILSFLRNNKAIACNRTSNKTNVCQSCVFMKQIKLPFLDSSNSITV
ncbi:uncharacterized protein [Rutidosis leptorrhynchoides]|uniref:uncharacterized protein n=1 Tax=Rutidosis leptorrhynchoides TaxID=125765 RepID=UPI003A998067